MNALKSTLSAALAATLRLPGLSLAAMVWHPAKGEAGDIYHPHHFISTLSRAEAQAEARLAMRKIRWHQTTRPVVEPCR